MNRYRIPYFDFYPSDFMHGVRGLSAQEVGVYTMMLCRIYEENGPVEYHVMRLATYCGMRETTFVKTLDKLIELGKLELVDGMLSNKRAEAEISSRANKLKNNSKAGKASAKKRQQKQRSASTDVQQTFNHTDTDTDITSSLRSDVEARARTTPKQDFVSELSDLLDAETIEAIIDHRRKKRAPITARAAKLLANELRKCADPRAAADMMILHGWQGLKAEWVENRTSSKRNDPPPKPRTIGDAIRDEARRHGVLRDEPDSENRGFHSEGYSGGNVRVLDLAFKPALKSFG